MQQTKGLAATVNMLAASVCHQVIKSMLYMQERHATQQQRITSAQADLSALQISHSALTAEHASALTAQQLTEQRLASSSADVNTRSVELTEARAEIARLSQVIDAQAAESSSAHTQLSVSQTHLEHSQDLQKQMQEKLQLTENNLASLQQQHYQTGVPIVYVCCFRPKMLHQMATLLCMAGVLRL